MAGVNLDTLTAADREKVKGPYLRFLDGLKFNRGHLLTTEQVMKKLATVIATLTTFLLSTQAQAKRHYYHHHYSQHFGRHLAHHWVHRHRHTHVRRYYGISGTRAALPGPCRTAARMGGPCGCWTAHVLLGRLDHVWRGINLWLASDWLRFPHVPPAHATAAVWPGRHVAPIVPGSYRDGKVTVRDYWGTWRVRTAGLVFVDPGYRAGRSGTYKVLGAWPL
jgi:hypothetical protein